MAAHPNAGGIAINWLIFGSAHHETRPAGGVLENFTMCAEKDFSVNHHIKTICDPVKAIFVPAHYVIYTRGYYNLDENGEIVSGSLSEKVHFDKIRINHYFTKSREEYLIKKNVRGDVNNVDRPMGFFNVHDRNDLTDTEILSRA